MTYSIVARDRGTGQMGVAVQSHWFSVGSVVTWAQAGVGAVATQAFAQPSYGPLGLDRMRAGGAPPDVLQALLAADPGAQTRQVAMVDALGRVAAHTGERCLRGAGHITGEEYSVQANMMLTDDVPEAMSSAFESSQESFGGDLVSRLLAALDAAEAAGGDIRGRQSAALLVVGADRADELSGGSVLELRVEDHPEPLVELRRLVEVKRAYDRMNAADAHLARGEIDEAAREYELAQSAVPGNVEFTFWRGVTLANLGRVDEAKVFLERTYAAPGDWKELLRRLPDEQLPSVTVAKLLE